MPFKTGGDQSDDRTRSAARAARAALTMSQPAIFAKNSSVSSTGIMEMKRYIIADFRDRSSNGRWNVRELSAHAFFEGAGGGGKAKLVARVSDAVGAGRIEVTESALRFDD